MTRPKTISDLIDRRLGRELARIPFTDLTRTMSASLDVEANDGGGRGGGETNDGFELLTMGSEGEVSAREEGRGGGAGSGGIEQSNMGCPAGTGARARDVEAEVHVDATPPIIDDIKGEEDGIMKNCPPPPAFVNAATESALEEGEKRVSAVPSSLPVADVKKLPMLGSCAVRNEARSSSSFATAVTVVGMETDSVDATSIIDVPTAGGGEVTAAVPTLNDGATMATGSDVATAAAASADDATMRATLAPGGVASTSSSFEAEASTVIESALLDALVDVIEEDVLEGVIEDATSELMMGKKIESEEAKSCSWRRVIIGGESETASGSSSSTNKGGGDAGDASILCNTGSEDDDDIAEKIEMKCIKKEKKGEKYMVVFIDDQDDDDDPK